MIKPFFVQIGTLTLGLVLSGATLAQDAGAYVSGSIGQSKADIDTSPLSNAGATGLSTDDKDTAWKINLGYQFNRNWGVEVGYVDFGSYSVTGTAGVTPITVNFDVKAWTLAAVGTLPLGASNFSLFGKLGAYRGEVKGSGAVGATSFNDKEHDTDAFGGVGVRYDFNRNFGVQLEAEHFNGDDSINLFTVGLRYKF